MKDRSLESEELDDPRTPAEDVEASLDFMVWVNRYLGGTKVILDFFEKVSASDHYSILDLGTGSGDIPYALARWADRRSKRIEITALDINPICLNYAQKRFSLPNIRYLRFNAMEFEKLGSFDYVVSSMFFHHLTDAQIVSILRAVHRNVRRGFIINDLERGFLPYWGAALLSCASRREIVRKDATLSVKRGFKRKDFHRYAEEAGLQGLRVGSQPFFRMVMSRHF